MSSPESDRFRQPEEVARIAGLLKRGSASIEATVSGDSMDPALTHGERIVIRCGAAPARVGDVVALVSGDVIVTHRVVRRWPRRAYLLTRGDNSILPDPPYPEEFVLGVVDTVLRADRWEPVPPVADTILTAHRVGRALESVFALATRISPWVARSLHWLLYKTQGAWSRSVSRRGGPGTV